MGTMRRVKIIKNENKKTQPLPIPPPPKKKVRQTDKP